MNESRYAVVRSNGGTWYRIGAELIVGNDGLALGRVVRYLATLQQLNGMNGSPIQDIGEFDHAEEAFAAAIVNLNSFSP